MRRRTFLGAAAAAGAAGAALGPTPTAAAAERSEGLQLVWGEDFSRDLNPAVWSKRRGSVRYPYDSPFNPHLENASFDPDHAWVEDGHLKIRWEQTPSRANGVSYPYTTGLATTAPGYSFRYGYFETRILVPNGVGLWPAVWLLPTPVDTRWPPEMDIAEFEGRLDGTVDVHFNLHWREGGRLRQIHGYPRYGTNIGGGWHTYGMRWEQSRVAVYLDGRKAYEYQGPGIPQDNMYLIISGAINRPHYPPAGTMLVDYVGVWQ